ncbi:MAG: 23S rRNA (pseudouridine(1915)-N(3))-methyltransferase RlmH [Bacteroidetes bacterium]|nr:23S rRNA (pseudouridine(1915)-N(3))-methyltransferase RlmH [Bacteroidota bacterium]MBU1717850.1 23S rRNA (pseudouridine(1915)-N(3))-methyltransferase RlmH [Bacteroidota bacterium]
MKVLLLVVGHTDETYLKEGIAVFVDRLKHYADFTMEVVSTPKSASKLPVQQLRDAEANLILGKIKPGDHLVLLDEAGKQHTSVEFAEFIGKMQLASAKRLVFVIGGANGFSEKLYKHASQKFSLSKMTFTHQMIRLLFVEQLYRAFTILKGEKYHRE